jgi:uncharacterized membrane protein
MYRAIALAIAVGSMPFMAGCAGGMRSGSESMRSEREMTSFRATGNEPGWRLEITDAKMTFIGDYGKTRIEAPTPAAETTAVFRRYAARTGGHDLMATIFDRPCRDTNVGYAVSE